MELGFETIGNATVICHDRGPVLATDPWITGGAYFGSWALSHEVPDEQKSSIQACPYIWVSHGHPDHLSAESLALLRQSKILLPDHVGGRIRRDLVAEGYQVHILPDREWIQLSPRIRVMSIPDYNQDAVLLIDIGGVLVLNLNDAGDRGWGRTVRSVAESYPLTFMLALSGYGDADMINFFEEDGTRIPPPAAERTPVGQNIAHRADLFGVRYFVPFSSMHRYQRSDSEWANEYVTTLADYPKGFSSQRCELLPAFIRYDCLRDRIETIDPPEKARIVHEPSAFGDDWNEQLSSDEAREVRVYLERFELLRPHLHFVNFRVGGRDNLFEVGDKKTRRGVTFEVPRNSLLTAVRYRIFDDLLIGNFMKTTLHGPWGKGKLYPHFSPIVAKYGDNGGVYTQEELNRYFERYRARDRVGFVLHQLEDKLMRPLQENTANLLRTRLGDESELFRMTKRAYWSFRRSVL